MKEKLSIIKVGGKIVESQESLNQLLDAFKMISGHKVLVHGGGRSATTIAGRMGIETKMVDGRRITDESMLEVVTMVYAGLVNKNIVSGLQARGCNAVGLTGADLDVVRAIKRPVKDVDYGFVGDVVNVNVRELDLLLKSDVAPVMAPLTHNGEGKMLNTNADTIASELAQALSELYKVHLIYCFEKKGVLSNENDDDSVIDYLSPELYEQFKNEGVIHAGMIPKLDNAFAALHRGVYQVVITNTPSLCNNLSEGTIVQL